MKQALEDLNKEHKDLKVLICPVKRITPEYEESECDFCGVVVFNIDKQEHNNKICLKCAVKRMKKNKRSDKFRLTEDAKKEISDGLRPKMTAS